MAERRFLTSCLRGIDTLRLRPKKKLMFDNHDNFLHVGYKELEALRKEFVDSLGEPLELEHPVRFSVLFTLTFLTLGFVLPIPFLIF